MNFEEFYNNLIQQLLKRELTAEDGIKVEEIEIIEQLLGFRLPKALREYYRIAGNLDEVNRCHNRLETLDELAVEDDYLIFMEENQVVVIWGIRTADLSADDPEVWQGNNAELLEWYSEETSVSGFLQKIFLWTFGLDEDSVEHGV